MAITTVNVSSPVGETIYTSTAMGNVKEAVKASSALVLWVKVDNSANSGAASYVKLWNLASGSVTVGTTDPDQIIYAPASAIITVPLFTNAAMGITFGTALTAACLTTGGTGGTTSPSSSVIVTIAFV